MPPSFFSAIDWTRPWYAAVHAAAQDILAAADWRAALDVVRDGAQGKMLVDALRNHRWLVAFIQQRAGFGPDAEVWLFGHALMEKLVAPYKAITAHTWVVSADDAFFRLPPAARRAWIDAPVAGKLAQHRLSTASFTPLPALGVPGWWAGQDRASYGDVAVFRPKRVSGVK